MGQEGTYKPTTWQSVQNATYPIEGAGNTSFSNAVLAAVVLGVPFTIKYYLGLPFWLYPILVVLFALPSLASVIYLYSRFAPRNRTNIVLPGKPLEHYMIIHDPELKSQYSGYTKIPMETFFEAYFVGKIDIVGDIMEMFEARHDWAAFQFTTGQFKFFLTQWIPETLWHSRNQDENQVRDHYDRGDDFYEAFLGPRMVYTSGIVSDPKKDETLEEMQDNKMELICNKIGLKKGEKHLDIGCGWGTLTAYAAKNFGTDSTGVTLAKKQTEYGNQVCEKAGVKDSARIKCMDYRDIPTEVKYDKITCVEMAEHVGLLRFDTFLNDVRERLADDGLFYMQVAGLRATWQYEDFIWGLFMGRYIFPGADASTPLYWYLRKLEINGFEIHNVDTVGVHYSATLNKWRLNWIKNRDDVRAKYGEKITRVWDIFLAWSTIIARQGSATCFQIVAHKNRNAFDRAALINNRTNASVWKSTNKTE